MPKKPLSDEEFFARYHSYESAALDEYLKHCRSETELRELIGYLIEHRELLRDFEMAQIKEESSKLFERLRDTSNRRLLEELRCFKDVLSLHKRRLALNGREDQ